MTALDLKSPAEVATVALRFLTAQGFVADDAHNLDASPRFVAAVRAEPTPPITKPPAADTTRAQAMLAALKAKVVACRSCGLAENRRQAVFGAGSAGAALMFVGEAPGFYEDQKGEPFVGEAGQLLNRMLLAMRLTRADVFIANVIKCRPPNNRTPTQLEVQACQTWLTQQIAIVRPTVIVALGRLASQTLLQTTDAMGRLRGRWHTMGEVAVMPTFHPAYLLRVPHDKALVWGDLKQVMAKIQPRPQTLHR